MTTLQFGPASANDGFTQYITAAFNDRPPARIVRELLQNSLDAAAEAGETIAQVRFQVEPLSRRDLPDAEGYTAAFRKAVKYHKKINKGDLPDAAQQVVKHIESGLNDIKTGEAELLSVVDNGNGLDSARMNQLLADGSTAKSATASGSYGVGHLTPFALSNLRYILYGGLTENGRRIVGGRAILAAHLGKKGQVNDAKGYLIKGFRKSSDGNLYNFLPRAAHPKLLTKHLDAIHKQWGHGCAVLIPAYNYFGNYNNWLKDIVFKVAAYNFAPAIHREKLVITVQENGTEDRLDERTLPGVLEPDQDRVRAARSDTLFAGLRPSGQNAYQILQALTNGNPRYVSIKQGKTRISLVTPFPNGPSRIDLFRNGMWITDSIPLLGTADFASRQPFHAVIEIDAKDGGELQRLIRKAEGPMHDNLFFENLLESEKKKLKQSFSKIKDWINGQVPEITSDAYTVDDFLVVSPGDDGPQGQNKFSFWGLPTAISRQSVAQGILGTAGNDNDETTRDRIKDPGPPRPYPSQSPKPKPARPLSFRSAMAPDGPGKLVGSITNLSDFTEAWVAFKVDENTDSTCDRIWPDEDVAIKSFLIRPVTGNAAQPEAEIDNEGRSVKIRDIAADTAYEVQVEYAIPVGLAGIVENPVFRLEMHHPPWNNEEKSPDDTAEN